MRPGTLGDFVIALVAFWAVAAVARDRRWVLRPTAVQLTGFVAAGVLITIVMERLATQVLDRPSSREPAARSLDEASRTADHVLTGATHDGSRLPSDVVR